MALKSLEALKNFIAKNPEFKAIVQGLARDGTAIATMPVKVAGEVRRGFGEVVQDVAGLAGDVAGFAGDVGPRLEVGKGDAEIDIPLPITAQAKMAEGIAGLAEKGGEALSEYETPLEKARATALAEMDRRIAESMGQDQQPEKAMSTTSPGRLTGERPPEPMITDADEGWEEESFASLSPEEQEAHRKRKGERIAIREQQESLQTVPYSEKGEKRQSRQKAKKRAARQERRQPAGEVEQAPADTAKERMLGSIKEDPTGEEYDTAFDQELPEGMEDAVSSEDVDSAANAETLFETVHGGPFDPNSSMDRAKLEAIKKNLVRDEYKGLTPNQFALKMYREAA